MELKMNAVLPRIFAFLNAVVGTVVILMGLILGIAFIADTLPEDLPPFITSITFLAIMMGVQTSTSAPPSFGLYHLIICNNNLISTEKRTLAGT